MRWLLLVLVFSVIRSTCLAQDNIVDVYIFISADCPVCQKYMNTVNALGKKAVCGNLRVNVLAVFPSSEKGREIRAFKKEYSVAKQIEVVRDKGGKLVKQFRARVTPEVFVVFNDSVRYSGAIDNWFFELGNSRTIVTERYVEWAIEAICKDVPIVTTRVEPIGCLLEVYE